MKLWLVINYQNLNHILVCYKFPLSNKSPVFQHLSNAKIFAMLNLKVGFWQVGHPKDRFKIAFCSLDHHYHWTILPFSQFQKTMVSLFWPPLSNALIYVDETSCQLAFFFFFHFWIGNSCCTWWNLEFFLLSLSQITFILAFITLNYCLITHLKENFNNYLWLSLFTNLTYQMCAPS